MKKIRISTLVCLLGLILDLTLACIKHDSFYMLGAILMFLILWFGLTYTKE